MIIKIYKSLLVILFIIFIPYNVIAEDKIEHKIAVLVNEDIITSYDIIQRLKLTAIIQGMSLNAQNTQLMLNNVVEKRTNTNKWVSTLFSFQLYIIFWND